MTIKFFLNYITFLLCISTLISCSVSSVTLEVVRPAEIDVPKHIQKVFIVNRSAPSKNYQFDNILDGILSGEGVGDDKQGSEMCILGLKQILRINLGRDSRFDIVNEEDLLNYENMRGTGTSEFPKPIKWKKINKVFKNYDVDGLIVLETFDSQSSIINGGIVNKLPFLNKKKNKVKSIKATLDVTVELGWRIYDIKNQKIIDKQVFTDQKIFSQQGLTFEIARDKLPTKRYAISQTGLFAGEQYGFRISPKKEIVKRSFYKKANKSFKVVNESFQKASRLIKDDQFEKSATIWRSFVTHENTQIAGRACFNMALVCELKNKFNLAVDWIEKSISYNNEKAVAYLSILKDRQNEIKRVKQQLKK